MDRNSLQYHSLRQKQENTERQLQHLYTLLYSLSLEVTKLRNSQTDADLDSTSSPSRHSAISRQPALSRRQGGLPLPSTSEEPSDAINRLLAATRS